tara:strand:- start:109 stop:438 length:330 start_codon:yes stop_codon:yes gene_type:complete
MSEVFKLPLFVCTNNPQMITAKTKGKYHDATIRSPDKEQVSAAVIAINHHDQLTDENARLREAFSKLKGIALQEREWRKEDSECGNSEVKESVDALSSKIDELLNKDTK